MRPRASVLALILLACSQPAPAVATPSPSPERGVLDVTALLDLSGGRAPSGAAQRNALQLWTDQPRSPAAPRVRLRVIDLAGSDARLLLELRRAAEEDRADAVIVGVPITAQTPAFAEAVALAALPILLTLPHPEPAALPGGRWTFALAPAPEDLARTVADALAATRGPVRVQLVSEAPAAEAEAAAVRAEWQRRDLVPLTTIRVTRDDPPLATLARTLAVATSVHVAGSPRDHPRLAQTLRQSASAPAVTLSYLAEPAELGELRDAAIGAIWPGPSTMTVAPGAPPARRQFVQAYADRHGTPSAHAASAYDALALLALAAERGGADDRERLRERLAELTFVGAATTYRFSATRHAGFDPADLALLRWSGAAIVVAPLGRIK